MHLAEKILQCRKKAGLSQEALAERIGVSRQAVSKWETGEAMPELSTVVALAKEFGVTTDWLLSDEEEIPAAETPKTEEPKTEPTPSRPGRGAKYWVNRYGWVLGVYVSLVGAGIAGLGALARFIAGRMMDGARRAFDSMTGSFGSAPGYAFGEIYDPIGGQSSMIGSLNSAMNAMAQNNPVSILGGVMIVLGIVLILGGVILAIVLRRWGGKKS